jgi:hypothetical protein
MGCDGNLVPDPNLGKCAGATECASAPDACSGAADCCEADGWACLGGHCTNTSESDGSCIGTGCGGAGSNCDPGYRCTGGVCLKDEDTCAIIDPGVITPGGLNPVPYENPIESLGGLLGGIGKLLYAAAIGIGLFFIIKSGYKYMLSEGDPRKVQEAQEELTSAVLGIFFILLSVFIMDIIIDSIIG